MHPIHLSNDKAIRSLTELENFLADLSTINLDELQQTLTPEPLRVRYYFLIPRKNHCAIPKLPFNWIGRRTERKNIKQLHPMAS